MRRVFSNADWSALSFHDVHVHAYRVFTDEREVRFDIDYPVEWIRGDFGRMSFKLSPATLVFDNASLLHELPETWFILSGIERVPQPDGSFEYELRSQTGPSLRIRAQGFRLYLRAEPVTAGVQRLSDTVRGPSTMSLPQ